jgi:hypothetical protein
MSSTAAPLRGVGVWAAPGTASTPPPAISRGSPSDTELAAFKHAVRPSWWRALWPLYTTAAFGAAVVLVASAAPPTITVRRMLTPAAAVQQPAPASALAPDEYKLPNHWQAAPPRPCDPLSGIGC